MTVTADKPAERAASSRRGWPRGQDAWLGVGLAVALALIAFTTGGGEIETPDAANTWVQIILVLCGAGVGAAALLARVRPDRWGGATLWLFAGLAGLTFLSMAWSVQPADSWLEANGTLSYLAAFTVAVLLARWVPGRWPALIGAVAAYAVVISGYALVTKVFPAAFGAAGNAPRLRAPFDYFNATGLVAAVGLPAWLWLAAAPWPSGSGGPGRGMSEIAGSGGAARGGSDPAGSDRSARRLARVVSVPALGTLVTALVLSYGRGALAAAVIGLGVWFALVPARLRGVLVLGCGALVGGAVSVWASTRHALAGTHVSLAERVGAGHSLGLVLVVALVVLVAGGVAVAAGMERTHLTPDLRRRIGTVLIVALGLVPVAGVGALAASSRGLGGEVSHLWSSLTSPKSATGNNPGRLADLGSSRPRYWGDGLKVGEHAVLAGVGASGFGTACRRYESGCVPQAHSYVVQTFADLGLIGVAVSLALLVAWALAVRRTFGSAAGSARGVTLGSARGLGGSPEAAVERAGLVTLLAIVVIFGVHSTIDWTWFVPGAALPALLCAGWLAGRGPLAQEASRIAGLGPFTEPGGRLGLTRRLTEAPLRTAGALGLCTLAVLAAWIVWQPQRSWNAQLAATSALSNGQAGAALTDARTAVASEPFDLLARETLSAVYLAVGDTAAARHQLVEETTIQPSNFESWLDLGQFDATHGRLADARAELARARSLDSHEDWCALLAAHGLPAGLCSP